MIGEMYVVNMLRLSGVARAIVAARIGVSDPDRQLKALRETDACERIATQCACRAEEAFSFLSREIKEALCHTVLPRFERHHLSALLDDSAKVRLGTVLRCSPSYVASFLFDPVALTRSLNQVAPTS